MKFKNTTPAVDDSGAAIIAQLLTNDTINQVVDDTAVLNTGIARGDVVKYSVALSKWVICDGTAALNSTDSIGIVEQADGTSGQVRISGVYLDAALTTLGAYYCQADGTLSTIATKVFCGNLTSAGRLCMPGGGGGGGVQPATTEALGGVIVGKGLAVDAEGILSLNPGLPSWANYRGDGSDGDFTAAGGETLSGVKQYKSFTIGAGLTVNVGADPLIILCQGDVLIDGTLNGAGGLGDTSNGGTAAGGTGTGGGGNGGSSSGALPINGSGGGGGGNGRVETATIAGGTSNFANYLVAAAEATPSSVFQSLMAQTLNQLNAGAGGGGGNNLNSSAAGAGGGGGGTIILAGETVINSGTLTVAGGLKSTATGSSNNEAAGGGGGGAAIVIIARNIIIAGTINVAGGAGGLSKYSAGNSNGGAGWYKIFTAGA